VTSANAPSPQALQQEILADARRHGDRLVRSAKVEAQEILAKAKADAEKEVQDRMAQARGEAQHRRDLVLATVPIELSRMRNACIEAILEGVYGEARDRLLRREGFDYGERLAALAAQGVSRIAGQEFVLELSEADARAYGANLAAEVERRVGRQGLRISVAPAGAKVSAGVIVRDATGRQVWDNSLLGRLDRFWPALRRQIASDTQLVAPEAPSSTGGHGTKES